MDYFFVTFGSTPRVTFELLFRYFEFSGALGPIGPLAPHSASSVKPHFRRTKLGHERFVWSFITKKAPILPRYIWAFCGSKTSRIRPTGFPPNSHPVMPAKSQENSLKSLCGVCRDKNSTRISPLGGADFVASSGVDFIVNV